MNERNGSKYTNLIFLSDQPLNADRAQEMRFGHPSIVDNLKTMVTSCPTPFTIGLFGKWGTGKTTILDALIRGLKNSDIAVVKIDAWKHEGNALRRNFLKDAINQLHEKQGDRQYLSDDVTLNQNLQEATTRTIKGIFKADRIILPLLVLAVVILVGIGLLIYKASPSALTSYISSVVSSGVMASFLIWLLQHSFQTETLTTTVDRFEDPDEFENEFKKILDKLKSKRLLVIIDNLDRVSCEKAVEILSTVKTFLEQDKCVFLIACDAGAIKKHLEAQYIQDQQNGNNTSSTIDGNEFLRKFFNSFLIIPEFIDTELQTYTEIMLRETNINISNINDVSYVISRGFQDNPRQIKQFINAFLSHFLLAMKREESGDFKKGSITENTAYLAKDLIIRMRFPEYYESVEREELEKGKNTELDEFLQATRLVQVGDRGPFRYMKLSPEEIEMPEIKELQIALQDNNANTIKEIIGKIKNDKEKLNSLEKFVSRLITRNNGRALVLTNVTSSFLNVLRDLRIVLDERHFYQQVAELLNDDKQLKSYLQHFDPDLIFNEILARCGLEQKNGIILTYTQLLNSPSLIVALQDGEYVNHLLLQFMLHKSWISLPMKSAIISSIRENYCRYEILSMFMGKSADLKEFVNNDTLMRFITLISTADIEEPSNIQKKIELISDFKDSLNDRSVEELIKLWTILISTENGKPYRDQKDKLLQCAEIIENDFDPSIRRLNLEIIRQFSQQILAGINNVGPWEQKRIFIPTCLWLNNILDEPSKPQINSVLNKFFVNGTASDLKFVFDKIKSEEVKRETLNKQNAVLTTRVTNDSNIFDLLYPIATDENKTKWLTNMIQTNHEMALKKLQELNYRIKEKKLIVEALLTIASQIPTNHRQPLYEACNNMKAASDPQVEEKFVSVLKFHLKDTTPESQEIGLTILRGATYLSQAHKRDIATETIEWLSTLPPNSYYQPSSITSLLVNWGNLTNVLQSKCTDFIFDKLIRRGTNSRVVDLGFNWLNTFEPKLEYDDYSKYYDDILSRIEIEPNEDIKSHLIHGIKSMLPKKNGKESKEFWGKIRNLP